VHSEHRDFHVDSIDGMCALWLQRKNEDDKKNRADDAKNRQVPVKQVLSIIIFTCKNFPTIYI